MNNSIDFEMLKQPTHEKVANYLRKDILLGRWKYGEHLNEKNLAQELHLSRGPIRDALKALHIEGLIETQSNGRSIVIGFNRKSFLDWSKMRLFLEKLAVEECIELPDSLPRKCKELNSIVTLMEQQNKHSNDRKQHIWLDLKFHMNLVQCSENRALIKLWKTLSATLLTMLELIAERYDNEKQIHVHKLIIQNMENKEKEKALQNLEDHIKDGESVIQSVVKFTDQSEQE